MGEVDGEGKANEVTKLKETLKPCQMKVMGKLGKKPGEGDLLDEFIHSKVSPTCVPCVLPSSSYPWEF